MDIPSPPLSHSSPDPNMHSSELEQDASDTSTLLNMSMDYLTPLAYIGLDSQDWSQQTKMELVDPAQVSLWQEMPTCAPNDTINFNGLSLPDDGGFQYDFTFGNELLSLPSPPATSSSSDPPSPSQTLLLNSFESSEMLPVPALEPELRVINPSLATQSSTPASSLASSPPTNGTKRTHAAANNRPKTSHTTIERRYRTNLNARMIGLRQAVPALRVLDKNIIPPDGVVDVVDDRGYVDGVKAAKKNSKASILGKAAEYIMVLKRREKRLRGELQAVKSLFLSLVPDGEPLLSSWESNYYAQHGGEQSDELSMQDSIDDDDDDEGDDLADEAPKPAKKLRSKLQTNIPKVGANKQPVPVPVSLGDNGEPQKRKRGRPRKVQPVPNTTSTAPIAMPPSEHQFNVQANSVVVLPEAHQVQPGQYLLAAFAFFSFFGTSRTTLPLQATHEGSVLNTSPSNLHSQTSWLSSNVMEFVHLTTSILLLISLLAPYLPTSIQPYVLPKTFIISSSSTSSEIPRRIQPLGKSGQESVEMLKSRLRLNSILGIIWECAKHFLSRGHSEDEGRMWERLARLLVFKGERLPLITTFRLYFALASCPSVAAERALLVYPVFPSLAMSLWLKAKVQGDELATLAFHGTPEDALATLKKLRDSDCLRDGHDLAISLVQVRLLEGMKHDAQEIFIHRVLGDSCDEIVEDRLPGHSISIASYQQDIRRSGKTIIPEIEELLAVLHNPSLLSITTPSSSCDGSKTYPVSAVREVLLATQLFVQLFPRHEPSGSTTLPPSPPPSPPLLRNREEAKRKHELRCLLGSDAFDCGIVERARDAVVEMLERS